MGQIITYGEGGFDPSKPNDNIVSVEEVPDPPAPPKTTAEIIAEQLAALDTIEAPYTNADVIGLLSNLRNTLGGMQ